MSITEHDFWNMTLAEVNRAVASRMRVRKAEAQDKASFDYILAQLFTRGCNIAFSGKGELPVFDEVYSFLYEDGQTEKEELQAKRQKQKDELSALRFQLFAQSYNKRFKEANKEE